MKTPELEKIQANREKSQTIGEFLEWLQSEKGFQIGEYDKNDRLMPVHHSVEKLLAEFFGINLIEAERERQALLKSLQK